MSISLTSALTVPKVGQDYANNMWSERIQRPTLAIYPRFNGQDNVGRQAHPDSQVTLTAGASDPRARIVVENALRPDYSVYLNADGIEGDLQGQVPSFGRYDTMLGKPGDRSSAFGLYQDRRLPQTSRSASSKIQEQVWQERMNDVMRNHYQQLRYANYAVY